jgi:hypothetical protein
MLGLSFSAGYKVNGSQLDSNSPNNQLSLNTPTNSQSLTTLVALQNNGQQTCPNPNLPDFYQAK